MFVNVLCLSPAAGPTVSAAALFSADLWRLSRTALPAQLLLSTGGAGELDTGRLRGHQGVVTIDIILDRRPIDRYCLLALTSGGAAILNRSPAPFTVMCLAGAMSCQRI